LATLGQRAHADIYPLSIWIIPPGVPEAENAIELFRRLPQDADIWNRVMSLGVLRFAIFDAYCDLMAQRKEGARALEWIRSAARHATDIEVEWDITPAG
jgi:hypothetical protein